jgi:hypothetical protein
LWKKASNESGAALLPQPAFHPSRTAAFLLTPGMVDARAVHHKNIKFFILIMRFKS